MCYNLEKNPLATEINMAAYGKTRLVALDSTNPRWPPQTVRFGATSRGHS